MDGNFAGLMTSEVKYKDSDFSVCDINSYYT